jgi:hypothetical protein
MRAKVFILLFLLVLSINCYSQVKSFRFGVQVAPNLAWISPETKDYENEGAQLGFSWGLLADVTLTENYFINTGAFSEYLNFKMSYPDEKEIETETDTVTLTGAMHRKYKLQYIEVPLAIKLKTNQYGNVSYFGEIGLGTAFNIKAKSKDEFIPDGNNPTVSGDEVIKEEVTLMKESLIVGAGIEYEFDKSLVLLVELTFKNGLNNILKGENVLSGDDQIAHLRYFQLNIGLIF